jgi:hypothetical protein
MTTRLYDGDTFDHRGYTFRVTFTPDQDAEPPWQQADGHGIVSDWTTRDKAPGERVLATDHTRSMFYDVAATLKIARRDGWGPSGDARPAETARQRTARAVEEDFEYLRLWCADQWQYVGVTVCQVDDDDICTDVDTSLWGVETFNDYHMTVARELADDLMAQIEVDEPDAIRSDN